MMEQSALAIVYWPGMSKDIRNTRDRCADCNRNVPTDCWFELRMTTKKLFFFPSILQISDAPDSDLAAIFESEFIKLMCEAGETCYSK